jgi:glucokinase
MGRYCIGVDFGGTSIKFGWLDEQRRHGDVAQLSTPSEQGAEAIIQQICRGVCALMERESIAREAVLGVGIGSPGPLDIQSGRILETPNIPGMTNVPLRDEVAGRLGLPATLENDANAAAYAEFIVGAGRESREMVMLTLGTGVGSGIVHDGEIIHGAHGLGGELGHLIVHPGGRLCGCGQRGCLEQYCSAVNLGRNASQRLAETTQPSLLREKAAEDGHISARHVAEACRAGDELARELWEACCRYLAIACVNICRVFDPDRIVLAGGMTQAGETLLEPLRRYVAELTWNLAPHRTKICIATLGADAGAIGAAGVAWRELDKG